MQYEMAEYDQAFLDRIFAMSEDEILAYIQGLPRAQQRPMAEAILHAATHRALEGYINELYRGFSD
jgi:hypothetical protein